ncbi:aldo/keto reductase family protein [Streptomyces sp. NPDC096198]|uniref:aldo/keto reductase family protein n=1 Tax=Streptomyces sp. NPDC096198 TaxID=3366080 RepID=UPI003805A801
MEYRRLGRSGLHVSSISFGNWFTHGHQLDEEEAHACIRTALDEGITTFDTADMYSETRAESVLGRALSGVRRESLEICTKVFWPTGPGRNDRGLSRKHIRESCEASLHRLKTDYLDLYQAHRYDRTVPLEETMLAFADLVRQGKVLYIGVSEWTAEEIARGAGLARELNVPFISNQPQYSMLWRVIEAEVIPASRRHGIGQMAWSPLAQGVLTGKYRPGRTPPPTTRLASTARNPFLGPLTAPNVLEAVQKLKPLAGQAGLTMAQLALAWVLSHDDVASAVIGSSKPQQVVENTKAAGTILESDLQCAIDNALGDIVVYDPRRTYSVDSPDFPTDGT